MPRHLRCVLVRHGTAATGPDDRTRALTPAGRAEVLATARALASRGVEVAEIRHSGLARAQETAEILGETLAPLRSIHTATGLAPEDDPAVAAAELELAVAPLMLVGHLPHLARLVATLVGESALTGFAFAPATAVGLERRRDGWTLDWVVPPRAEAGA